MTTIARAQRAINKARVPLEIVRGEGYHYFIYESARKGLYETVSVMIPYTNMLSAQDWVTQARWAYEGIKERIEQRGY